MTDVKRYEPFPDGTTPEGWPVEYVAATDHDRMVADLTRTHAEAAAHYAQVVGEIDARIAAMVEALESIVEVHGMYCEHHVGVSSHSYELANMAQAALDADRAALAQQGGRTKGEA